MVPFLISDVFPFAAILFLESFYRMHRASQSSWLCRDDDTKQRFLQGGAALFEFTVAVGLVLSWRSLSVREVGIIVLLLVALQTYSGYFFSYLLGLGSFYSGLFDYLLTLLGFYIGCDRVWVAVSLAVSALAIRTLSVISGGSELYLWASVVLNVCLGFLVGVLPRLL